MRTWIGAGLCLLLMAGVAGAAEPEAGALPVHVARYGAGEGPREEAGVWHLLDDVDTPRQSNAIAFDREHEGARSSFVLEARLRVLEGGDGGAFAFLATDRHGVRGPAPFAADWAAPTFGGAFVVAIDVHDPPTDEPFGPLDAQTRQMMGNLLLDLWAADRKAVMFVTHDLEEAIALADRVVIMSAGPEARIIGDHAIDLERPRDAADIRLEPRFHELHKAIWSQLKAEVIKAYGST